MASNDNYQSHLPTPPSPTFKTHPTRRRIIRKSPRSSIRLSTLKKTTTLSSGNDNSTLKPHLLQESQLNDRDFNRLHPNSPGMVPTNPPGNAPTIFNQSSSKSSSYAYQPSGYRKSNFQCVGRDPLKTTSIGAAPGVPGCDAAALLRLFSCPGCMGLLRQPVTLDCGHTCCKRCAVEKCPECGVSVDRVQCVNVLVRSIMNKLVGDRLQEKGKNLLFLSIVFLS